MAQSSFANLETLLGDLNIDSPKPAPAPFRFANGALNDLSKWIRQPDTRHHDEYHTFFQGLTSEYQEKLRSYLTPEFRDLLENVDSLGDLAGPAA
jgi:hypothetical protein